MQETSSLNSYVIEHMLSWKRCNAFLLGCITLLPLTWNPLYAFYLTFLWKREVNYSVIRPVTWVGQHGVGEVSLTNNRSASGQYCQWQLKSCPSRVYGQVENWWSKSRPITYPSRGVLRYITFGWQFKWSWENLTTVFVTKSSTPDILSKFTITFLHMQE